MKQRNHPFTYAPARALVAAAMVAAFALAAIPAIAANSQDQARVEARIKDMHARLKITAAEEEQWAKVAVVMRDNATKMDELNNARLANAKTMNAIDDLKTYGEITDAHAAEIKKFTAEFAILYASMSDAQKTEADALFRNGVGPQKSTQRK